MTPREYQVVRRFALGWTWEQIMHDLGVSRHTVHKHRVNALARHDAPTLVDLWRKLGWLSVP